MAEENESIGGYKLRRMLHTAQYSQVFEVVEPGSNRHFAMKVLLPEHAGNAEQRAMLFHEADVGIKMKHENVVPILKVSKDKATPHIVMEFFPAGSLRARLMSRDAADKFFLFDRAKDIFKQMATGLAYMSSNGWVHCDLKPDNVLADNAGRVKLIDFAITKRAKTGFLGKMFHKRGKPQGTPSYMSPEQIRDDPLDVRADIYSYGAMLYELTTSRPPFKGSTPKELLERQLHAKPDPPFAYNPDVTEEFSKFVLKMLAKKKEDRFQNFHEILIAMKDIRPYKVTAKPPVPPPLAGPQGNAPKRG
jgi:serine/threonine protein kinase